MWVRATAILGSCSRWMPIGKTGAFPIRINIDMWHGQRITFHPSPLGRKGDEYNVVRESKLREVFDCRGVVSCGSEPGEDVFFSFGGGRRRCVEDAAGEGGRFAEV